MLTMSGGHHINAGKVEQRKRKKYQNGSSRGRYSVRQDGNAAGSLDDLSLRCTTGW